MTPETILRILDHYFPEVAPFLLFDSPYTLLIAVVLSAQTTDQQVNRVTPLLFSQASTPFAMIAMGIDEITHIIRPCGLASKKAQAIWKLSSLLVECYHGQVPCSLEALTSLPGVGRKSASVVLTQGFGYPAFPVDRHIYRSAHRWGLSCRKSIEGVEHDLKQLFPSSLWGKIHLQMIAFARAYCPARGHDLSHCPICSIMKEPCSSVFYGSV